MNKSKRSKFIVLILMILFFGALLAPEAGATPEKSAAEKEGNGHKSVDDSQWTEWKQAHTVEVEVTTVYEYKTEGDLEITETYAGEKLKGKFKVDKLTKTKSFTVPSGKQVTVNTPEGPFTMQPGDKKEVMTEKSVVLTTADDPYMWSEASDETSYPQWTWSKILWFYELEDPINLIWEQSNLKAVKSVILGQRWVDNPSEYTHYISYPDGTWKQGDGVADSKYRLLGGYHARLWELPNGAVVANAHHDDDIFIIPGHQVDRYEAAEDKVAGFFNTWSVLKDYIYLANPVGTFGYEPYNDGKATLVT